MKYRWKEWKTRDREKEKEWADGESAHNTVTEDPAVRCSCWQHVWKHSNGQQQQLLWEGRVCLIHCFCAVPDFPALSRDLNLFSLKFCCCSFSRSISPQTGGHSVHKQYMVVPTKTDNRTAQNVSMYIHLSENWHVLKTQGLFSTLHIKPTTYLSAAILLTSSDCLPVIVMNRQLVKAAKTMWCTYTCTSSGLFPFQWVNNVCKCVLCCTMSHTRT